VVGAGEEQAAIHLGLLQNLGLEKGAAPVAVPERGVQKHGVEGERRRRNREDE
jgi:hypothetical protein